MTMRGGTDRQPMRLFRAGRLTDAAGQPVDWQGELVCRRCGHRIPGTANGAYIRVPDLPECPACGASADSLTPVLAPRRH